MHGKKEKKLYTHYYSHNDINIYKLYYIINTSKTIQHTHQSHLIQKVSFPFVRKLRRNHQSKMPLSCSQALLPSATLSSSPSNPNRQPQWSLVFALLLEKNGLGSLHLNQLLRPWCSAQSFKKCARRGPWGTPQGEEQRKPIKACTLIFKIETYGSV